MQNANILVVEDEGVTALDIEQNLGRLGYGVLATVDTGEAAVERAAELRPDLVLMDIKLKGAMDGITAAALIKERVQAPVVFLTAFADEGTLQRAKVAEPYGYILKPFEELELRTAIELALHRRGTEPRRDRTPRLTQVVPREMAEPVGEDAQEGAFQFLRRLEPFQLLSERELRALSNSCRFAVVEAGEYISYEGDVEPSSFIVRRGRVAMVKTSVSGRELIVELLPPGDVFGLISQFEKEPSTLSARAQTDTEVLWVPRSMLALALEDHPEIYRSFVEHISQRLRRSHDLSRGLAHDRVEVRIATTLVALVPQFARSSEDDVHTIDITRQEIADLTGTTPETAIRTTKAMERGGLLDLARPGVIKIRDLEAIEEIAEGL